MLDFTNTLGIKSGNVPKYEKVRDVAKPMPRHLLTPIVSVLAAIHNISDGRASIPELCDVLVDCFDRETMIIYSGTGYGLAEAIDGSEFDGHSGYVLRTDILSEFFNSKYWSGDGFGEILINRHERLHASDFLMTKKDATVVAQRLWAKFFEETRDFPYEYLSANIPSNGGVAANGSEIDPSDLPLELDAANVAYRAVTNGYGDQSATFRNRLVEYLKAHYPGFKSDQMERIATVANPDKTTGRKKAAKK